MDNSYPMAGSDRDHAADESKENVFAEHDESSPEKGGAIGPGYDMPPAEEQRMVRKCDWRILPIVSALYVMSFLNRVNIGGLSPRLVLCPCLGFAHALTKHIR